MTETTPQREEPLTVEEIISIDEVKKIGALPVGYLFGGNRGFEPPNSKGMTLDTSNPDVSIE